MVTAIRKTSKNNNEYIDIEHKRAEAFVYWQVINRLK